MVVARQEDTSKLSNWVLTARYFGPAFLELQQIPYLKPLALPIDMNVASKIRQPGSLS
jgi:hypothetical protein